MLSSTIKRERTGQETISIRYPAAVPRNWRVRINPVAEEGGVNWIYLEGLCSGSSLQAVFSLWINRDVIRSTRPGPPRLLLCGRTRTWRPRTPAHNVHNRQEHLLLMDPSTNPGRIHKRGLIVGPLPYGVLKERRGERDSAELILCVRRARWEPRIRSFIIFGSGEGGLASWTLKKESTRVLIIKNGKPSRPKKLWRETN